MIPSLHHRRGLFVIVIALAVRPLEMTAQRTGPEVRQPLTIPTTLRWRNIGPNRGGRSIAVAGVSSRPLEYYFGATGGGLWKTTDGGTSWAPVTDGQIRSSSVGAVAVSESNPDVVYIGMGEAELRANVMQGDGVYKSTDAGRTWSHAGLSATQTIARIRVDPTNPDLIYVAALGHPYGPNEERGVFRSNDGGRNWKRILFRDASTGASDLAIDPSNPRTLYASLWHVYRTPWLLWSGGDGSGLFKSTDGGDTWVELTRHPGMPSGTLGKIALTVSPADPRRVYANIEANNGGLYRSDDGGDTWSRVNAHRDLWQRSFYFMHIQADPKDRDALYILNSVLSKSTDGGMTYREVPATHADHHDLWVDPQNPNRMINANDGGAAITVNGGSTWTAQSYPTAQLYRVATTHEFPYHACGAQQDNTTLCVPSKLAHLAIPAGRVGDWFYNVGGGESGAIAPDPRNPNIFYAGETNSLTRFDRATGSLRDVQPIPRVVMGEPASAMSERWNWTYPIVISPKNPQALYVGSQHLWATKNDGKTWKRISADLTRADPMTLGNSGGPIILDQDGPEIYATIFSIAPSPRDAAVIWVGSDDGLVHVTRNEGASWRNVTPPDLTRFTRISRIDASPHRAGTAYVAANRNQLDDRAPYIWRTADFGHSWTTITDGIRADDFVHVVREDPKRAGLLYAGTEHGVYVSLNDGASWQSLSLNLPDVQVSDLTVTDRDIVIATHGRSFFVLDDLTPLRQISPEVGRSRAHLFRPDTAFRRQSPAVIDYYLAAAAAAVRLDVLSPAGEVIQTLLEGDRARTAGFHRTTWNLRYPGATVFAGIVLEGPSPAQGPWAAPADYRVRLTVDGTTRTNVLHVHKDPRLTAVSNEDLRAQLELATQIRDATSAANGAVIRIRDLRAQIEERLGRVTDSMTVSEGRAIVERIGAVERELYQVRNQSAKDKIAFPIKLNNRLSGLLGILDDGDAAPTEAQRRVFRELSAELAVQLDKLNAVLAGDVARFNRHLERTKVEPVSIERMKG